MLLGRNLPGLCLWGRLRDWRSGLLGSLLGRAGLLLLGRLPGYGGADTRIRGGGHSGGGIRTHRQDQGLDDTVVVGHERRPIGHPAAADVLIDRLFEVGQCVATGDFVGSGCCCCHRYWRKGRPILPNWQTERRKTLLHQLTTRFFESLCELFLEQPLVDDLRRSVRVDDCTFPIDDPRARNNHVAGRARIA